MAKSVKNKSIKATESKVLETHENISSFTLPDNLPTSEIAYPTIVYKKTKADWNDILKEFERHNKELEAYNENKTEPAIKIPFQKTESDYLKNEVFVLLLPLLEETLNKAKIWNAFQNPKCFFSGVDWLAQELWNNNPIHPARKFANMYIFNMPWVREYLKEHPRPLYPKSWLWPEEYAATFIQKTVRQYFVQREDDVQEMRIFWKKLKVEREHGEEINVNPMLAWKFAGDISNTKSKTRLDNKDNSNNPDTLNKEKTKTKHK